MVSKKLSKFHKALSIGICITWAWLQWDHHCFSVIGNGLAFQKCWGGFRCMLYRRLTCMLRFRIHIISLVSQTKLIFFFVETYYWLFRGGGLVKVGGMSFKIMIHDSPGRLSSIESLITICYNEYSFYQG